jgi:hypothetical protein
VLEGVEDGTFRYGAITDRADLELNLAENAIPLSILHAGIDDFPAFLAERRALMSATIERYYKRL